MCVCVSVQLAEIQDALRAIRVTQARHTSALHGLTERTKTMAAQDDVNAIAAQLSGVGDEISAGVDGIRADIQALKDAIAAGQPVDLTALEASVARVAAAGDAVRALDQENPGV